MIRKGRQTKAATVSGLFWPYLLTTLQCNSKQSYFAQNAMTLKGSEEHNCAEKCTVSTSFSITSPLLLFPYSLFSLSRKLVTIQGDSSYSNCLCSSPLLVSGITLYSSLSSCLPLKLLLSHLLHFWPPHLALSLHPFLSVSSTLFLELSHLPFPSTLSPDTHCCLRVLITKSSNEREFI